MYSLSTSTLLEIATYFCICTYIYNNIFALVHMWLDLKTQDLLNIITKK